MKKLLLLSALAIGAMSANAASYTDYFKVYDNGTEVANGAEIVCNHSQPVQDLLQYELYLQLVSQLDYNFVLLANYEKIEGEFGLPQLCFTANVELFGQIFDDGNCWNDFPQATTISPEFLSDGSPCNFEYLVEAVSMPANASAVMKLTVIPCDGDEDYYEPVEDASFTVTVRFAPKGASVEALETEFNGEPVYYNLQGVRVANPEKGGLYVVKRGEKISKEFVR